MLRNIILGLSFLLLQCNTTPPQKKMQGEQFFESRYHPIIKAIDEDNINVLSTLVNNGNINVKGGQGLTFVFYAYLNNKKNAFSYLIDQGSNINLPFEKTPGNFTHLINKATEADDDFGFKKLVKIANLNVADERGLYPLHNAIMVNNEKRLFELLDNRADINSRDKSGQTPIYLLCALNKFELAYQLIQKGADPKIPAGKHGTIALMIQEKKFPPTTKAYLWQQKIREELIKQGIKFPVKRPWDK